MATFIAIDNKSAATAGVLRLAQLKLRKEYRIDVAHAVRRRWQLTALLFGMAALFSTARPVHAQQSIRPSPPVVIAPVPLVPPVASVPMVPFSYIGGDPSWSARPYWALRRPYRIYRPFRRGGWYGPAWGPRGRMGPVIIRRW
jgi:hypothetical protein